MGSEITQENIIPKKYTFTGPDVALPMVIKLEINNNLSVLRVFVNPMSKVDILYWSAFLKMKLPESMLKPCEEGFLKGTFGKGLPVKGYIDLDTTFGKGENTKTIKVRYFVVESPPSVSIYNVVIGWPSLKDLKAVLSVAELTMEYPVGDGKVGVVEADLEMAKKCRDMCPYYVM